MTTGTVYSYTEDEMREIVGHVTAAGAAGVSRADMLAVMPMQKARMKWLLALLAKSGRISSLGVTRWTRYYSHEAARVAADCAQAAERERIEADHLLACFDTRETLLPIRRPVVDARQAPPLRPMGPRSVFELAAAA